MATVLHPDQMDALHQPCFPTRVVAGADRRATFPSRLALAMSRAIDQSDFDRTELAERMSRELGERVSKVTLDAYTSAAKTGHNISLVRFRAFVMATGARWLWDFVLHDDGMLALEGADARFAEMGLAVQRRDENTSRIRALRQTARPPKRRVRR
ncbi:MAG: hypothetical protein AAFQ10_03290 [Pseudomonadota bacterium]